MPPTGHEPPGAFLVLPVQAPAAYGFEAHDLRPGLLVLLSYASPAPGAPTPSIARGAHDGTAGPVARRCRRDPVDRRRLQRIDCAQESGRERLEADRRPAQAAS